MTARVCLLIVVIGLGRAASAQDGANASIVNRLAPDNVTVRAFRLHSPLRIDGRLEEEVYRTIVPISDFIQQEPDEGQPATEKTEAWILFDEVNLYICARNWDSHPEREVANELRRDNGNILGNENLTFAIDTLYDRRNGYVFQTNALGALRDMAVTDDQQNQAWNGIWNVKTARFENGWTVEVAIPFKTLRYRDSGPQTWGINLRRLVKWKNEFSYLSLVPAALGTGGISRMASAATVVGLETPAQSKNLELKPYAVASSTTDRNGASPFDNRGEANAGLDFKYGLTRSLIVDATYRTDFAQVEEDVQQINLTRFNLFFPEKRDFFIEGQGIFDFGGVQAGNSPGDVPLLFFSRQIGLSQGQAVPVVGGVRLTGRAGAFSIGALNIQTDDKPSAGALATNFSALRLKRNLLRRSNVGMMATRRGPAVGSVTGSASYTTGIDATMLFFKSITITSYYALTSTPDQRGDNVTGSSYRGRFDFNADRYGALAEHMLIDADFRPEVGYVRRSDIRRSFGQVRFSPRPRRSKSIRKFTWQGSFDYVTDAPAIELQSKEAAGLFRIEFQSSDQFSAEYSREFELLPNRFAIAPGVIVPAGGYSYSTSRVTYSLGQQRRVSGRLSASTGSLYGGTKSDVSYSGRWSVIPQFAVEPSVTLAWGSLPYGDFTARLIGSRFTVTPSARMQISSLVQFNVDGKTLTSSVRLRWEYTGGSDLFVVYSDGRETRTPGFPGLLNRTIAIKATRLLRF
ncbi:MAG TPA: DUF5916 domain-containing protein [Vicinamibacterales bacterium]|nr:DUF5916 domain-containing protein [Vicinamibacterales bacterium]